ncbi:MAG TPA: zf-HC2 domain-containing protein [Bryobacteraceae bacterium]|nr:zf-HC2 domain-containing protein [Bryobacteraceae bacterium]
MHAVVVENLEEYLAGTLEPADRRAIEAHLNACEDCREEMSEMREVSRLFVSLRPEEEWQPSPGFYAGVVRRVEEQVVRPSFASLFSLDFVFGRRLVFASLVMLAVLGSYLVTRETEYVPGPSPETVMAEQNSPSFDSGPGRDNMLVTMTAYEQH